MASGTRTNRKAYIVILHQVGRLGWVRAERADADRRDGERGDAGDLGVSRAGDGGHQAGGG
jgi:hypothetical protein